MTALTLVDDADWIDEPYYDEELPPGRRSWRGPGYAGGESCECGVTYSWPDTTEEDRATMVRLFDEHQASCPVAHPEPVQPAPATSPRVVAELHARRRADLDVMAEAAVRTALRMLASNEALVRAGRLSPERPARTTAIYLESVVANHPALRTWTA